MKKIFLMAAFVLVSLTGAFAQFNPMDQVPDDPEVRKGVLPNGLTYYIRHNGQPENQADFYILHNVGAIQEEDSQQGLAHFTEHMAFNGTKNFPDKQLLNWAESIGVKFGANLNASTGLDVTQYMMIDVPLTRESIIDSALMVLHDWSYFISMEPAEIDKERGVIMEELRTRNTADWRIFEKSQQYLFGTSKYSKRNLIGYEQGLRTFPYKDIKDFYHRWYRTDLQAIIVVGDFDVDAMEAKVKKLMSDIPAVENPEEKVLHYIPENEEPIVAVLSDPELTSSSITINIKYDTPEPKMNNTMIMRLTDLFDRIGQTIVNERLRDITQKPNAPFTDAGVYKGRMVEPHDFLIAEIEAREGETLQAFEAIYTEMERVLRHGFTESELERAKTNILRSAQAAFDRRNDRRNGEFPWTYMSNYRFNTAMPSAEKAWEIDQMLINLVELPMLNQYTKEQRFGHDNQVIIFSVPKKDGVHTPTVAEVEAIISKVRESEIQAPADDTVKEPLIPAGTKLRGSKVKTTATDRFGSTIWTLKNGVRVIVKPTDFKADEILASAYANGGTSNLPLEMIPSAEVYGFYKSMSGVGKFSATELRKQLAGKAVSISPSLDQYQNGFVASASPKDLETMMQLFYLSFTAPRYDTNDYSVMIDRLKATYLNMTSNPMFILQDSLSSTLYAHNPRNSTFTYESIDKVKFEHMKAIHDALFTDPASFVFTFVGNVDMKEFKPMVEKYLGSLPKTKGLLSRKDDKVAIPAGVIENRFKTSMQMPKTTVAYIHNGKLAYNLRNDLLLGTLGDILDLRYTQSIREEKGGTYGVSVQTKTDYFPDEDYLMLIYFDTDPNMADELIEIVKSELETIARDGVRADDLAKVKEHYTKEYPDDIKQNSYWRRMVNRFYLTGHDMATRYIDEVNSIASADIQALARKILDDNNIVKVIMDPAAQSAESVK